MVSPAPLYSLITLVLFVCAAVVLTLTGTAEKGQGAIMLAFFVSTLPSLVASLFAERVSRDVRNGTVVEKAKEGAAKALDEAGVTDAVKTGDQTTPAALQALAQLLDRLPVSVDIHDDTGNHKKEGGHHG